MISVVTPSLSATDAKPIIRYFMPATPLDKLSFSYISSGVYASLSQDKVTQRNEAIEQTRIAEQERARAEEQTTIAERERDRAEERAGRGQRAESAGDQDGSPGGVPKPFESRAEGAQQRIDENDGESRGIG